MAIGRLLDVEALKLRSVYELAEEIELTRGTEDDGMALVYEKGSEPVAIGMVFCDGNGERLDAKTKDVDNLMKQFQNEGKKSKVLRVVKRGDKNGGFFCDFVAGTWMIAVSEKNYEQACKVIEKYFTDKKVNIKLVKRDKNDGKALVYKGKDCRPVAMEIVFRSGEDKPHIKVKELSMKSDRMDELLKGLQAHCKGKEEFSESNGFCEIADNKCMLAVAEKDYVKACNVVRKYFYGAFEKQGKNVDVLQCL
jgi:hypothetical protein